MENLTNFDTLIYIYLGITLGTLIYPVELWFRVNFVNFIFMVISFSSIILFRIDLYDTLYMDFNIIYNPMFQGILITVFAIVIVWISVLRVSKNISLIDSLFLGFLPFTVVFIFVFSILNATKDINILGWTFAFIVAYGFFVYQKLLYTIPFAVKKMADDI